MKKIIRLSENDLTNLVKKVVQESVKKDLAKINELIDEYNWNFDTIKMIVEDIFIESPHKLENLEEKEDYIHEILKHIKWGIKNGFWDSMEEWFKDVDESYH